MMTHQLTKSLLRGTTFHRTTPLLLARTASLLSLHNNNCNIARSSIASRVPRQPVAAVATVAKRMFSDADAMGSVLNDSVGGFVVRDADGNEVQVKDLLQKVTLIVNIDCKEGSMANKECGELQQLYMRFKDKGFQILAFPSGQFQLVSDQGTETPASRVKEDLKQRFNVTFPIMDKINVNGEFAHPMFMYLQKKLSGFPVNAIKWDYTIFLCIDGKPRKRYAPTTSVKTIEGDVAHIFDSLDFHESESPSLGNRTTTNTNNMYNNHQQGHAQYASPSSEGESPFARQAGTARSGDDAYPGMDPTGAKTGSSFSGSKMDSTVGYDENPGKRSPPSDHA